jgi:hypothetical protein
MTLPTLYYANGTAYLADFLGTPLGPISGGGAVTFHIKNLDGGYISWDGDITTDPFPLLVDPALCSYVRVDYPASGLNIGGSIAEPALEGTVNLSGLNASANGKTLTLQEATVRFFNANPSTPLISLIAIGEEKGTPFNAYVTGSLDQLRLWSTLPLDAGESFIPDLLGGPPSKDAAPQPKPDAASQKPAPAAVVP